MPATEGLTDEELLQMLQEGDEHALTLLYRRHWQPLFLSAYRVLKDQEACKDLVQELFTEIWQQCARIRLTGSFKAYLAASIRYRVFRYIRRHPVRDELFDHIDGRMETASPESELAVKELQALLNKVVDGLPEKCALIYRMSREQHLSYKEIAGRLNVSVKTVENQINIALRKLRMALHYIIGPLLLLSLLQL
ncbi:RNA polymerase sigma-70 factor [Chitinophaga japonensis]|uniref:RNA polymerase sigma-70 factor (ECF subfamily) n=1 Tax=Chitinophaga japonensis TaxID=104662 RepID=A0A562TBU5_CHIJA|nr:RNA polymerase sigma-70 factor [Chitinophaga japonensis]TWI90992.1 RNA polymerase sigma-70 factor (ECF subfamily) [Chitinophaga japonensis]